MQLPYPFNSDTVQFSTDSNGVNYAYDETNDKLYIQNSVGEWDLQTNSTDTPPVVTVSGTGNVIESGFPWILALIILASMVE